jgi:hypothetical protein
MVAFFARTAADGLPITSFLPGHSLLMMVNLAIGLTTPPVGAGLFVGCTGGKTTMEKCTPAMLLLWPAMLIVLFLTTCILWFTTFLPNWIMSRERDFGGTPRRSARTIGWRPRNFRAHVAAGNHRLFCFDFYILVHFHIFENGIALEVKPCRKSV